jgi:hypothetical protein
MGTTETISYRADQRLQVEGTEIFSDKGRMFGGAEYLATLTAIHYDLRQIKQWQETRHYSRAGDYYERSLALVELLEAANCGSVGGFDGTQQSTRYTIAGKALYCGDLYSRFIWLCRRFLRSYGDNEAVSGYLDGIHELV